MAKKEAGGSWANQGHGISSFWQGIVEIVLRGVLAALATCTLIAGCAACSEATNIPPDTININANTDSNSKLKRQAITSAVWVILISFPLVVYQVIIIIIRQRNIPFLNTYFIVFAVVEISVNTLLVLAYFVGGVVTAATSNKVREVQSGLAAASVFAFIQVFALFGMMLWMALFLMCKWNEKAVNDTRC